LLSASAAFSLFYRKEKREKEKDQSVSAEGHHQLQRQRWPLFQPSQPRSYLLNIPVSGFPHVIKLYYAGK
jgi:hypothetical protein